MWRGSSELEVVLQHIGPFPHRKLVLGSTWVCKAIAHLEEWRVGRGPIWVRSRSCWSCERVSGRRRQDTLDSS